MCAICPDAEFSWNRLYFGQSASAATSNIRFVCHPRYIVQYLEYNSFSQLYFHDYNNYSDFTLVEGNTAGVINWNRVKKNLTCGYEETLCDTRGNSSSSNDKEDLKQKHFNADVYSTVVYGLPHITLM